MAKFSYKQLMTETSRIQVGDEVSFDDVLDYMGRIKAVAAAGAKLAERNLILDVKYNHVLTSFVVAEREANPAPDFLSPSNAHP